MLDKIKSKLLTKLFIDWVNQEFDVELLETSKTMIQQRQEFIEELSYRSNPPTPIGFRLQKED